MDGMSVAEQPPVTRRLLPHERWYRWLETSGRMGRVDARAVSRQLRKYGPDGSVLNDAAMANWSAGVLFLLANLVIGFTGHRTVLELWLWGAVYLFFTIGFVRFVQGVRLGQQFRATTPPSHCDRRSLRRSGHYGMPP
jgi:hypothetical protein